MGSLRKSPVIWITVIWREASLQFDLGVNILLQKIEGNIKALYFLFTWRHAVPIRIVEICHVQCDRDLLADTE